MTKTVQLCLFCEHFSWSPEEMWGMGSEYTGPMFDGGWAECAKGKFKELEFPRDADDWRKVILIGQACDAFELEASCKSIKLMET